MKHFSIQLNVLSPLAIRSDHAPGGAETAQYITGTTLAGSLAAVHRLLHADRTGDFESLFLSGQVHYPNLYPASFKNRGMQDAKLPVYPVPKTAQTCKRSPGFRHVFEGEDEDDVGHGVRDGLLDWTLFKLANHVGFSNGHVPSLKLLDDHKSCTHLGCTAPMDHFAGYYRWDNEGEQHMIAAQMHTRLQTHTGINRASGTVEEGILYNREVFDEQMRFWGMVKVPEHLATTFHGFIEEIAHAGLVRIGTSRTRGLGKVSLGIEPIEDEDDRFGVFKARLASFNRKLVALAKKAELQDLKPCYFPLTLHSPLILHDSLLRYRERITGEALAELVGLSPVTFGLVYQAASTRRVTGWNELWGTPRTNEYAIETGSVFLFSSSPDPDEAVLRALFELEEEGIGRRRAEGFGRVCISDPFHLEVDLR